MIAIPPVAFDSAFIGRNLRSWMVLRKIQY
jgi:hypothetical protein